MRVVLLHNRTLTLNRITQRTEVLSLDRTLLA
jgi:hypothetical protein